MKDSISVEIGYLYASILLHISGNYANSIDKDSTGKAWETRAAKSLLLYIKGENKLTSGGH